MTEVVVHYDYSKLPSLGENVIPVQIYGLEGLTAQKSGTIGNSAIDTIKRLGIKLTSEVFDFLTLALAVTAADTFVQRKAADDGWTREILLKVFLHKPSSWAQNKQEIEKLLHFLSGDIWKLDINGGGCPPPTPYSKKSRYQLFDFEKLDCACLFSGGIDSTVGALDLLGNKRAPLLVSHSYTHDQSRQEVIAKNIKCDFSRFAIHARPLLPKKFNLSTDITMRTRSFNFFALGTIAGYTLSQIKKMKHVELFVPENGFISLNVPLTLRRIGSLSTKTTHPYYLKGVQNLLNATNIDVKIINPYQFKTKGKMLKECADQETLRKVLNETVSCSNWKRKRKQCGRCVPCLIRRAAVNYSGFSESSSYVYENLKTVFKDENNRDDLFAIISMINKLDNKKVISLLRDSGPLQKELHNEYSKIFLEGIGEVERYLKKEGLLA